MGVALHVYVYVYVSRGPTDVDSASTSNAIDGVEERWCIRCKDTDPLVPMMSNEVRQRRSAASEFGVCAPQNLPSEGYVVDCGCLKGCQHLRPSLADILTLGYTYIWFNGGCPGQELRGGEGVDVDRVAGHGVVWDKGLFDTNERLGILRYNAKGEM